MTPEDPWSLAKHVVIGASLVIKGELSASEDLTLSGQVEGSVTLPEFTLTVGPKANIKAAISGKAVVIMGAVTGNVTATERVEVHPTGSVTGDIDSPRLAVADGSRIQGRIRIG
jgi:cytoskeletal protein CcmA (bactofilin family)